MIEVLQNYKTNFYKKVVVPETNPPQVKWQFIRRIYDFPSDLWGADNDRLEFFSPCFSKYIITDKKTKQFVIKDTYLEKIISRIPHELLCFKTTKDSVSAINRMKWIDENTLLIVNKEGIEKLIDVSNEKFEEI